MQSQTRTVLACILTFIMAASAQAMLPAPTIEYSRQVQKERQATNLEEMIQNYPAAAMLYRRKVRLQMALGSNPGNSAIIKGIISKLDEALMLMATRPEFVPYWYGQLPANMLAVSFHEIRKCIDNVDATSQKQQLAYIESIHYPANTPGLQAFCIPVTKSYPNGTTETLLTMRLLDITYSPPFPTFMPPPEVKAAP